MKSPHVRRRHRHAITCPLADRRPAGPLLRLCAFALLLVCSPPAASAEEAIHLYRVKPGDTCSSIAEDFYGDAAQYALIHRANDLGAPPHDLRAGATLRLPITPDAFVSQKKGAVQARGPDAAWSAAAEGLELYRLWRLNTLDDARALVGFRDDSTLMLRENTLIVIYGPAARQADERPGGRAELETGALRSRLAELSGSLQVETPGAVATLGDGSALVTVDDARTTRVSNHEGAPAELADKGTRPTPVKVGAGFGSMAKLGAKPSSPRPLPPAPAWETGPRAFPALTHGTVRAAWAAVPTAAEYFVELTADRAGVQVMQAAFVPAGVTSLEVRDLPVGTYYATVSTVDADGFESIPAPRLPLHVAAVEVAPGSVRATEPVRLLAGTQLEAPDGFDCRIALGSDEDRRSLAGQVGALSYPGLIAPGTVECRGPSGATTTEAVEIEFPAFAVSGEFADGTLIVDADQGATVSIAFDEAFAEPDIVANGFDVTTARVDPLRMNARFLASPATAAGTATIAIAEVPLMEVPVTVRRRAPVLRVPLHVGGGFSFARRDDITALGAEAVVRPGIAPWFDLSATLGAMQTLVDGAAEAGVFSPTVGVDARLLWPGAIWRPFAAWGPRAWFPIGQAPEASLDLGAGLDIRYGAGGLDARGELLFFGDRGESRLVPGASLAAYYTF